LAREVAVVPQALNIPQYFTVRETVMLGRTPHLNWIGQFSRTDHQVAEHAMQRTDTIHLAERRLGELSGGEQQRVLIARGLAQQSRLIMMDEPTAHLDLQYQFGILEIVRQLAVQDGLTVILAIHDLNLAARYADWIILLDKGRLRAGGPPAAVLTSQILSEVYQVAVEVLNGGQFDQPVILAGVERSHQP
ncbi:MAG: ABC transporter ATP-binding protein, partial [Anaerolineae bacterium]|nr:ABC transporter ATP-binding protein [Anaerolineae bacterium]